MVTAPGTPQLNVSPPAISQETFTFPAADNQEHKIGKLE